MRSVFVHQVASKSKVREHALLVTGRPPWVNILTLGTFAQLVVNFASCVAQRSCRIFHMNIASNNENYLVHDAVARLPNGEGTRADICNLLLQSYYVCSDCDIQQVCCLLYNVHH